MKTILLINGCVRGKNSRTLQIANTYIETLKNKEEFILLEKNLNDENLSFLTYESFDPLTGEQKESSPKLALEFATADEIILVAPFWEFLFPAVVSSYFELVSCVDIAFTYTAAGSVGLCKASSFKYIYTAGNYLSPDDKISEIYLKKLTELYGIPSFSSILVDGLDIQTNNPEKLINDMCDKIKKGTIS